MISKAGDKWCRAIDSIEAVKGGYGLGLTSGLMRPFYVYTTAFLVDKGRTTDWIPSRSLRPGGTQHKEIVQPYLVVFPDLDKRYHLPRGRIAP